MTGGPGPRPEHQPFHGGSPPGPDQPQAARGPLDDPQPARQRPGILTPAADSAPAVEVGDDSPAPGFRTVVFFLRDGQYPALVQALRGWEFLGQSGRTSPVVLLAVSAREPEGEDVITPVGSDPTGAIARTFGCRAPRRRPPGRVRDRRHRVQGALRHLGP